MGIDHCHSRNQQPCKFIGTQGTQQTQEGIRGVIYNNSFFLRTMTEYNALPSNMCQFLQAHFNIKQFHCFILKEHHAQHSITLHYNINLIKCTCTSTPWLDGQPLPYKKCKYYSLNVNRRKCLHKKWVQLTQYWFSIPTWLLSHHWGRGEAVLFACTGPAFLLYVTCSFLSKITPWAPPLQLYGCHDIVCKQF